MLQNTSLFFHRNRRCGTALIMYLNTKSIQLHIIVKIGSIIVNGHVRNPARPRWPGGFVHGGGTPSVHRYPSPKSPPSGRGLGGRSRRSPAGSVASLRKVLRFRVCTMPGQCFPISLTGLAPLIIQHTMYQAITKQQVPGLQFFQGTWSHAFTIVLIIRKIQKVRCQASVSIVFKT